MIQCELDTHILLGNQRVFPDNRAADQDDAYGPAGDGAPSPSGQGRALSKRAGVAPHALRGADAPPASGNNE